MEIQNISDKNLQNLLDTCSPKEKEMVLQILNEYTEGGMSSTFNSLLYNDYDEIPVDVKTFIHSPLYLGYVGGLYNEDGTFTVFPYWEKTLQQIFPDPLKPATCNTLALTGAIGLGKSFMAVICMLYELYRILCLKSPAVYYGIQSGDNIAFAFMNITLHASAGVAWSKCKEFLTGSPWFKSKGHCVSKDEVVWIGDTKNVEIICGSRGDHIRGRCLFSAFFDEISYMPNQDIDVQKEKAKELVDAAFTRMQSRFMKGEYNPTLLILASSKRTEQSYLEEWIANKKRQDSKTTFIVDEPQWVIRTDKISDRWFKVAIGNEFLPNEILPLGITDEEANEYQLQRGFKQIIDVPYGYYENFVDDLDLSLTDIAGISTKASNTFLSGERLLLTATHNYQNLFVKDIIEVGDALDDRRQYWDYIDLKRLDPQMKNRPLFIHMDLSIDGDKTGIGGVWIVGKKPSEAGLPESHDLYYRVAFAVSIKAPKGHKISFEKDRNFIYWLKEQGFNIRGISTDSKEAAMISQDFIARGLNYEKISCDIVDPKSKMCQPYEYLKSTIYENRIEMYYPEKDQHLLYDELVQLEKDNSSNKIDHPHGGCFTGDTQVHLGDNRNITFKELLEEFNSGKDNYVISINRENHKRQLDKIVNVQLTKQDAELIQVELDSGDKIRCTPDHRFMLKDETFCEAQNLVRGQELKTFVLGQRPLTESLQKEFTYKVVSITKLNEREDVYDLTTSLNHNFLLSSGVFVHNSKDEADCIAGSVYNASQYGREYAYNYGESVAKSFIRANSSSTASERDFKKEIEQREWAREQDLYAEDTPNEDYQPTHHKWKII